MTDEMYFGLALLPIIAIAAWSQLHRPNRHHSDWVAERHRKISRNGFKSRMGIRS